MLPESVQNRLNKRSEEYKNKSNTYIPLEITVEFVSPVTTPTFPIYFDAVLGNIVAQEVWGEYYGRIPNDLFIEDLPLPLKKHDFKENGYCWAASCGVASKVGVQDIDAYKRTFPGDPWVLTKVFTPSALYDAINGSGRYKSYLNILEMTFIEEMKFYAVGDDKEIHRLFSQVRFMLKKRSQGRGQVKSFSIKQTNKDYTLWKNNMPMRPIPLTLLKQGKQNNYQLDMTRLKPPYWDWKPETKVLCVVPNYELWSGNMSNQKKKKGQSDINPYTFLID